MTLHRRLTRVGDLERPDHYHLLPEHECYFVGEYTAFEHTNGLKWDYSTTNRLITNLKKKMDRAGHADWHYKTDAINSMARQFSQLWDWRNMLPTYRPALIPMPPSKARTDPMYDPRMMQMVQGIAAHVGPLDIRDCLSFDGTLAASHDATYRPSPDELYEALFFDRHAGRITEPPGLILLFDDVLTTGAHFVAASRKLSDVFPGVRIVGSFVARRRIPDPFADIDL